MDEQKQLKEILRKALEALDRSKGISLTFMNFQYRDDGIMFQIVYPKSDIYCPKFLVEKKYFNNPDLLITKRLLTLSPKETWDSLKANLSKEDYLAMLLAGWIWLAGKEKDLI